MEENTVAFGKSRAAFSREMMAPTNSNRRAGQPMPIMRCYTCGSEFKGTRCTECRGTSGLDDMVPGLRDYLLLFGILMARLLSGAAGRECREGKNTTVANRPVRMLKRANLAGKP